MPLSTRPAGGVDARATMVSWLETTTNASARCAFGRDLKSSTRGRSKRKNPLLETSAQPKGGASNPRKVPAAWRRGRRDEVNKAQLLSIGRKCRRGQAFRRLRSPYVSDSPFLNSPPHSR